jgi:hypothetical protein
MTIDEYAANLGKLVSNLQSLEFALRAYIAKMREPHYNPNMPALDSLTVGQLVPENAFTNYDSLGELIGKFNELRPNDAIDLTLVDLRDAIAHGRVSAPVPAPHFRILKFARPKNGSTTVTFSEGLTSEWFRVQIQKVGTEVRKVAGLAR